MAFKKRSLDDLEIEIRDLWDRADHCKDPVKAHEYNLRAYELVEERRDIVLSGQ
jgi:hypothetical protein